MQPPAPNTRLLDNLVPARSDLVPNLWRTAEEFGQRDCSCPGQPLRMPGKRDCFSCKGDISPQLKNCLWAAKQKLRLQAPLTSSRTAAFISRSLWPQTDDIPAFNFLESKQESSTKIRVLPWKAGARHRHRHLREAEARRGGGFREQLFFKEQRD